MTNLNDGVGKKIVEALKKQTEQESETDLDSINAVSETNLGVDVEALDEITNNGLIDANFDMEESLEDNPIEDFSDGFGSVSDSVEEDDFNEFSLKEDKSPEPADIPANIMILRKLISQLPSGVTRHTGAQIIRQTIEALGISMKSVLTEAQEVQNNLKESSKECQMTIQEYKRKISNLEKQTQNYQKQYAALNDLISLFIQTGK